MTNIADVVFVQVSGGRELPLKPCLNIDGGMQPRGVREVIAGGMPMLGILIVGMLMLGMFIPDALIFDVLMSDVLAYDIEVADAVAILDEPIPILFLIPDAVIVLDMVVVFDMGIIPEVVMVSDVDIISLPACVISILMGAESRPRLVPAWRMLSGRHWILPCPLAKRLSTQNGYAPVSKYCA